MLSKLQVESSELRWRRQLALDQQVELPLARGRVTPGGIVGALRGDGHLGPLLDGHEAIALQHLEARGLRVLVDLQLGGEARGLL